METWVIVSLVIIVFIIVLLIILTYNNARSNGQKQPSNILYPFTGHLIPPASGTNSESINPSSGQSTTPEEGLYLVGMNGGKSSDVPQIKCPEGFKINIVGAYTSVFDPFMECSNSPDPVFQTSCGLGTQTQVSCSNDDDCASGMICKSGDNYCIPKPCKSFSDCSGGTINTCKSGDMNNSCNDSSDCGTSGVCIGGKCNSDPSNGMCLTCVDGNGDYINDSDSETTGTCRIQPTCFNIDNGLNKTCSPEASGDEYRCRIRDASAYLADHCDGKQNCLGSAKDRWIPNDSTSVFGPLPCQIPAKSDSSTYATLPVIPGWPGGKSENSTDSTNANYNQGYYVHGIYTCIPDK